MSRFFKYTIECLVVSTCSCRDAPKLANKLALIFPSVSKEIIFYPQHQSLFTPPSSLSKSKEVADMRQRDPLK